MTYRLNTLPPPTVDKTDRTHEHAFADQKRSQCQIPKTGGFVGFVDCRQGYQCLGECPVTGFEAANPVEVSRLVRGIRRLWPWVSMLGRWGVVKGTPMGI